MPYPQSRKKELLIKPNRKCIELMDNYAFANIVQLAKGISVVLHVIYVVLISVKELLVH